VSSGVFCERKEKYGWLRGGVRTHAARLRGDSSLKPEPLEVGGIFCPECLPEPLFSVCSCQKYSY
jgi:hypothetical protein